MNPDPAMDAAIRAFVPCAAFLLILRYSGHLEDFAEDVPLLETMVGYNLTVAPAAIPAMIAYIAVYLTTRFRK